MAQTEEQLMPVTPDVRADAIEELLIAIASPDRHEDSPERKAAWDEIKHRLSRLDGEDAA
jgi:hypothetical protein